MDKYVTVTKHKKSSTSAGCIKTEKNHKERYDPYDASVINSDERRPRLRDHRKDIQE